MAETPFIIDMGAIIDQLQFRIDRLTIAKMDFERAKSAGAVAKELAEKNQLDLNKIDQNLANAIKAKQLLQESCCQQQACTFTLRS